MEEKKISIILPVYNGEKTIKQCIESILAQSYQNIELIIVDDGSTDRTLDVCELYLRFDNRVKIYSIENNGPGYARNYGLTKITGQYLAFVDADDLVQVSTYTILSNIMQQNDVQMVVGSWREIKNEKSKDIKYSFEGKITAEKMINKVVCNDFDYGGGFLWNRLINWEKIDIQFRNKILFPEQIKRYEDKCWILRVLKQIESVYITNDVIYSYIVHGESVSHNKNGTVEELEILEKAYKYLKKELEENDTWKEVCFYENLIEINSLNMAWRCIRNKDTRFKKFFEYYKSLKKMHITQYSMKNIIKYMAIVGYSVLEKKE